MSQQEIAAWGVSHFRLRDDTGALNTSAGWLAAEDVRADGLAAATTYRVRFSVKANAEQSGLPIWYFVWWRDMWESWDDWSLLGTT